MFAEEVHFFTVLQAHVSFEPELHKHWMLHYSYHNAGRFLHTKNISLRIKYNNTVAKLMFLIEVGYELDEG